jgi:secretion/DNA translocation related TadE-like protein
VLARHRAEAAADLAAIGAAGAAATGQGQPCGVAGRLAVANRARLTGCELSRTAAGQPKVTVSVAVPVPGPAGWWGPARSTARAGPAGMGAERVPEPVPASPRFVTPCEETLRF